MSQYFHSYTSQIQFYPQQTIEKYPAAISQNSENSDLSEASSHSTPVRPYLRQYSAFAKSQTQESASRRQKRVSRRSKNDQATVCACKKTQDWFDAPLTRHDAIRIILGVLIIWELKSMRTEKQWLCPFRKGFWKFW
jgi:hypothetical protein